MKSHYCGEITSSNLKEKVTICGWIHRRRDHGGVIFLDVRDIKGICQAVVNPDNKESFQLAESIRNEFVVQIEGVVRNRLEGTINKNMQTGEIEIEVANINILSKANTPVFPIDEYQEVNEDVRLKNRVLDLRRPEMNDRIIKRSKITSFPVLSLSNPAFLSQNSTVTPVSKFDFKFDSLVPCPKSLAKPAVV